MTDWEQAFKNVIRTWAQAELQTAKSINANPKHRIVSKPNGGFILAEAMTIRDAWIAADKPNNTQLTGRGAPGLENEQRRPSRSG